MPCGARQRSPDQANESFATFHAAFRQGLGSAFDRG